MRLYNVNLKQSNVAFVNLFYQTLNDFLIKYPVPYNINYFYNFGVMSGLFLAIQIITGIFLTMHYTPHIEYAFYSVDHIMRDISNGWLIRYMHSNGASMFFVVVYMHIIRGLYYGSYRYPRTFVWNIGVTIYILMMATAFLGYVLPWGQMSFWAATVITNFLSVIPYFGTEIVQWVWGGFSINNATLNRFFCLHYLMPFVILALVVLHILVLHNYGSTNPMSFLSKKIDKISFYPYFYVKDLFSIAVFFLAYFLFIFYYPDVLSHSDNYIPANPLNTPAHIVPEWYFLPYYAILRSIPNKTQGIIVMFISIFTLFFYPMLNNGFFNNPIFSFLGKIFFWIFLSNFFFLGILGAKNPETPYVQLGLICSHIHLLIVFAVYPMVTILSNANYNVNSFYVNCRCITRL